MKKEKIINTVISILLILIGILILVINVIIKNYDWHLRSWLIWLASYMIPIGIVLLGVSSLKTIKNKILKIFFITIFIITFLIILFIETLLLVWIIKNDYIKTIDGKEYIGIEYYSNRLRKTVYYYENYNIFAYKETKQHIKEFYNYNDYENPLYIEYYDENGLVMNIND